MGNWAKAFIPKSSGSNNTTARGRKSGSHDTFAPANLRQGSGGSKYMSAFMKSKAMHSASSFTRHATDIKAAMNGFAPTMSMSMTLAYPLPGFLEQVNRKQKKILFKTGAYARLLYRSKNDGYGTVKPLSEKGLSRKFTKSGNVSKTWQKAMDAQNLGAVRRPYRGDNAKLWQLTKFKVFLEDGSVIAGPEIFKKNGLGVIAVKPIPQLLDEGGKAKMVKKKLVDPVKPRKPNTAAREARNRIPQHKQRHGPLKRVRMAKKKHTVEIVDVEFRSFPFRKNIKVKTFKRYTELFREIPL